jgi:hypothetical protein
MSLARDERQELRHGCAKQADMIEVMYQELARRAIPAEVAHDVLLEWWRMLLRPDIEMPDFAAIFGTKDEE